MKRQIQIKMKIQIKIQIQRGTITGIDQICCQQQTWTIIKILMTNTNTNTKTNEKTNTNKNENTNKNTNTDQIQRGAITDMLPTTDMDHHQNPNSQHHHHHHIQLGRLYLTGV